MGLFDSLKAKKEERKEKAQQEREARKAQGQALLKEARELRAQAKHDTAFKKYEEACEYEPEAIMELAEIYKKNQKYEKYYELCKKHGSFPIVTPDYLAVSEALAECYRDGVGTKRNRQEAIKIMDRCARAQRVMNDGNDLAAELFMGECALSLYEDGRKALMDPRVKADPAYADALELIKDRNDVQLKKIQAKAARHFEKAAKQGDVESMFACAKANWSIPEIVGRYYKQAFDAGCYKAAAMMFWRFNNNYYQNILPDEYNVCNLGMMLRQGANAEDPDCLFAAALCYAKNFVGTYGYYHSGYGPVAVKSPFAANQEQFIRNLKKAYELGCENPGVRVMMAEYYAMGKVWNDHNFEKEPIYVQTEKDINPKKAFEMLKKVWEELKEVYFADVTDLPSGYWYHKASYLLCMMYFDGKGTKVDVAKAQEVLRTGGTDSSLTVTYEEKRRLESLRAALQEAQPSSVEMLLEAIEKLKNS